MIIVATMQMKRMLMLRKEAGDDADVEDDAGDNADVKEDAGDDCDLKDDAVDKGDVKVNLRIAHLRIAL